jgi:hypothetical protein
MSKFDGFIKRSRDKEIESDLEDHFERYKIQPLESLNLFPVYVRRQLLKRFLARIELFKIAMEIPGDIAELGVFRGFDLLTWANLLECYCIGNRTKIVYGFDNWLGFESLHKNDGVEDKEAERYIGAYSPSQYEDELRDAIKIFDKDRFIPEKKRIELVKGNISSTVPEFLNANPGIKFSLVHFDCDMYEPTISALRAIWTHLSIGGVMIFDEYAIKEWPGETAAVDEFFHDKDVDIKTFSWTNSPAAFLIKKSH